MIAIKNFAFYDKKMAFFQTALRCALLSFFIGQIGCVTPSVGQDYPTVPILYGILAEDWATGALQYRIATRREWRKVRVMRRGERLRVRPNMPLEIGDRIRTGPGVAIAIGFPNGSQLYVRSRSAIRIGSIFAFFGEMFVRVQGAFQVDTEFVTAGAEGTEWVMQVAPNGDTLCTVLEGRVRVASTENLWRSVPVIAGRQYVTRQARYTEMRLASPEELDQMQRWIRQIDRLTREPHNFPSTDRPYRPDPVLEQDEPDQPDWSDRPDRPNYPNWPNRPNRPDRPDQSDQPDQPDQPEWPDRPDQSDQPDQPDPSNRPDRPNRPDGPNQPDRPDRMTYPSPANDRLRR